VSKEDILEGMTAVVVVRLPEPQFEGQTKDALATTEVLGIVNATTTEAITAFLADSKRKADARKVMEKISRATKARLAARMQRDVLRRKTALESSKLPSKLADCRSEDVTRNEILIVEGDSAMGCFTGDTQVMTTDGELSFRELVADWERGVSHFGFGAREDGGVDVVLLDEPRVTFEDSAVVSVHLGGGDAVRCTPDHLFLIDDGAWWRADQLCAGTVLASLNSNSTQRAVPHGDIRASGLVGSGVALLERAETVRIGSTDQLRWEGGRVVVEVIDYTERSAVYDLSVAGLANFALANGVFVHNSAKAARDSEFQALLPIRGKILNTWRATEKQMLENVECAAIISALGAGSGAGFNLDNMRYGRFVTLTDADVDGHHIRTLLLTLCWRYMRPLIVAGRAFASVPPLYRVTLSHSGEHIYTYSDEEQEELLARLAAEGKKIRDDIQRYKGLGEMSADQLAETTMYPGKRRLRRLTVADAQAASACFETLMGNDAAERRRFIVDKGGIVDPSRLDI
jgi:DNA gyrase subunit B